MAEDFRTRARLVPKGNRYEDFEPGRVFKHHWGRTVTESESTLFSTLTLHFNPHYFNAAYARAHGHPGIVVNPLLVFTTVFGLTVEDLSEGGGPFLGVNELSLSPARLSRRLAPGRIHRARPARLGLPQGIRHRHLAHPGLQPARRARHRLQAHQPRPSQERLSHAVHHRRAPHDPGAGARIHPQRGFTRRQQARSREGRHPDGPAGTRWPSWATSAS